MAFSRVARSEDMAALRSEQKAELAALRADIEKSARDQTRWIVATVFGAIGLVLAIVSATVALLKLV